jgi:RimJ/RimL family protein N-acetyltransferase
VSTTTERLSLVPVGPEHVEDPVILHSGPDVARWYAGAWSHSQASTWAQQMHERWQPERVGERVAYRRSDGELIGRGGLTRTEIEGDPCLELGWLVREEHRGVGYATEIGEAGLTFAFDDLGAEEVVAFTEVHNHASRAVMTRLGMTAAGLIYRPGLIEGGDGVQPSAPFALHRFPRTDLTPAPPGHSYGGAMP